MINPQMFCRKTSKVLGLWNGYPRLGKGAAAANLPPTVLVINSLLSYTYTSRQEFPLLHRYRRMVVLRFMPARSSASRLMLFIGLCFCILQAAAVVLEKTNVSIGQLTVPEIEDKLQVIRPDFL